MKFDHQLAAYLYDYKSLMLEGIGTFTLDEKVRVPNEQEKEIYYPIEGLSFNYNPRSATDENVILFLIKKLGKIEPLIRSDLEYYLSNIKVSLNIGSPYTIEGIGTLNKNNQGIIEFTPGNFSPAKEELNPKRENANHNYPVRSKFSAGRILTTILIVIAAIAAISGAGWGILNFTKKNSMGNNDPLPQGQTPAIAQKADTFAANKNTETVNTNQSTRPLEKNLKDSADTRDSATYKMIFEITKSKERAYNRTNQLNNLHSNTQYDSIPINDSVAYYRLFLPIKMPPSDTARIKDSLQKFFAKKVFMEKNGD